MGWFVLEDGVVWLVFLHSSWREKDGYSGVWYCYSFRYLLILNSWELWFTEFFSVKICNLVHKECLDHGYLTSFMISFGVEYWTTGSFISFGLWAQIYSTDIKMDNGLKISKGHCMKMETGQQLKPKCYNLLYFVASFMICNKSSYCRTLLFFVLFPKHVLGMLFDLTSMGMSI